MFVPDPNFFGGDVRFTNAAKPVKKLPKWKHPFGVANQMHSHGMMANYRTAGLADMALAIAEGRPHRCSMELALHAVDVMTGMLKSGETGKFVDMQTTCERPAALGVKEAKALLGEEERPARDNSAAVRMRRDPSPIETGEAKGESEPTRPLFAVAAAWLAFDSRISMAMCPPKTATRPWSTIAAADPA